MLARLLGRLPERFRWTLHSVISHPLSEMFYVFGFDRIGDWVHDVTIPEE